MSRLHAAVLKVLSSPTTFHYENPILAEFSIYGMADGLPYLYDTKIHEVKSQ